MAKAQTDILVRQKQLAVGLPSEGHEEFIIVRPLTPKQLALLVSKACGQDLGTASLTQELMVSVSVIVSVGVSVCECMCE